MRGKFISVNPRSLTVKIFFPDDRYPAFPFPGQAGCAVLRFPAGAEVPGTKNLIQKFKALAAGKNSARNSASTPGEAIEFRADNFLSGEGAGKIFTAALESRLASARWHPQTNQRHPSGFGQTILD